MKILLSLYACEPNRGSEPGVGWAWALGMARRHETYVLTRANNRDSIEKEIDRLQIPVNERPRFIWVDLPGVFRWLKRKRILPVSLYYLLWQFAARRAFDKSGIHVDVIHHVTFCSYVVPGVWWNRKEKVVLGPLGGFSTTPVQFLRVFSSKQRLLEWLRNARKFTWRYSPFFLLGRANADTLLFTERKHAIQKGGKNAVRESFTDIGLPTELEKTRWESVSERKNQFVWAGTLEGWKACEIALRAFHQAFSSIDTSKRPELLIFGNGSEESKLKTLSKRLRIDDSVSFRGICSQAELWTAIRSAKAFVFTSIRDTCGSVNIEAMGCGTPILCFNHQGVGDITDDSCAIRIDPGVSFSEAVGKFADGMLRFANDDALVRRMGRAARVRAMTEFTWNRRFDCIDHLYRSFFHE